MPYYFVKSTYKNSKTGNTVKRAQIHHGENASEVFDSIIKDFDLKKLLGEETDHFIEEIVKTDD